MAGLIRTQAGDPATGDRLFREALEVFAPAGDISALLILLVDLATSAEHLGDPRRAALLGGAADGLRSRSGRDIMLATGSAIGWPVPTPPTGPDDPKAPWWAAGEKLSYDEALATAREPTVPSSLT